jgi:deoxyhypusine synthase
MDAARKRQHLKNPRIEIEARKRSAGELLEDMAKTAFQGRKLGEALAIWKKMLSTPKMVVFMGLSGAMVPAGMGRLVAYLIEHRGIDVLVTTGAALSHDMYQVLGSKHYIGTPLADDEELQDLRIDRVYDTYADEDGFYEADNWVMKHLADQLEDDRPYSTRDTTAARYCLPRTSAACRYSCQPSETPAWDSR